jgi:hypothetical protein
LCFALIRWGASQVQFFFSQWANLIGPSLKKNETMEVPLNRRFYFDGYSSSPFGPPMYLSRKVVCFVLFCSYEIHRTRMLQITSWVSSEGSWRGGVHGVHDIWTCGAKVLEYWMISSLKIKLNRNLKFSRGIGMCLGCCWKDLDEQDLMGIIW